MAANISTVYTASKLLLVVGAAISLVVVAPYLIGVLIILLGIAKPDVSGFGIASVLALPISLICLITGYLLRRVAKARVATPREFPQKT